MSKRKRKYLDKMRRKFFEHLLLRIILFKLMRRVTVPGVGNLPFFVVLFYGLGSVYRA